MSLIISISGMIGAGKTTFINGYAQYLEDVYHIPVAKYLEAVDNNELLDLMYEDPVRWTFTSQANFLLDKLNSMKSALNRTEPIILVERDYLEQLIFIEAQFSCGNVNRNEYLVYRGIYDVLKDTLPKVINYHIDAAYSTCIEHIHKRGRSCEQIIDEGYYKVLYDKYQKYYSNHPSDLVIQDTLDISTYERITKRILQEV